MVYGEGWRVRAKCPIQTRTALCLLFGANFASMSFFPLLGVLSVLAVQPVACGWADMLRTTTPTTPNPDKPGAKLDDAFLYPEAFVMMDD